MSPQARGELPKPLRDLSKEDMERCISAACLGRENEKLARLYYVDRLTQVDVAAELYLGKATVQRRLPDIKRKIEKTAKMLH